MSNEHVHVLIGAYALNAVTGDEREMVERHLRDCTACSQEVRELTATVARLGVAAAAMPPPEMKGRVITWIQLVRQVPPQVTAVDGVRGRSAFRARHLPRLVLAACVAAATTFGATAAWQSQEAERAEQRTQQTRQQSADLTRVLAAPDARTVTGSVKGGAQATVVLSRSERMAVFLAAGLPDLPDGHTYQLWFDDGGGAMIPAGLIGHDGAVVMAGDAATATGVGVTVEPAGGSPRPTTTALALMTLPA